MIRHCRTIDACHALPRSYILSFKDLTSSFLNHVRLAKILQIFLTRILPRSWMINNESGEILYKLSIQDFPRILEELVKSLFQNRVRFTKTLQVLLSRSWILKDQDPAKIFCEERNNCHLNRKNRNSIKYWNSLV